MNKQRSKIRFKNPSRLLVVLLLLSIAIGFQNCHKSKVGNYVQTAPGNQSVPESDVSGDTEEDLENENGEENSDESFGDNGPGGDSSANDGFTILKSWAHGSSGEGGPISYMYFRVPRIDEPEYVTNARNSIKWDARYWSEDFSSLPMNTKQVALFKRITAYDTCEDVDNVLAEVPIYVQVIGTVTKGTILFLAGPGTIDPIVPSACRGFNPHGETFSYEVSFESRYNRHKLTICSLDNPQLSCGIFLATNP